MTSTDDGGGQGERTLFARETRRRRQVPLAVSASIVAHAIGALVVIATRPERSPEPEPQITVLRRPVMLPERREARPPAPPPAPRPAAPRPVPARPAAPPPPQSLVAPAVAEIPEVASLEPSTEPEVHEAPAESDAAGGVVGGVPGGDPTAAAGPPGAGQGSGRGVDELAALAGYLRQINARIQRRYHYPPEARRARLEGLVEVLVEVDGQGRLVRVEVVRSSGHAMLDHAALSTIRSLARLPAPPVALGRTARTFVIPLEYALTS